MPALSQLGSPADPDHVQLENIRIRSAHFIQQFGGWLGLEIKPGNFSKWLAAYADLTPLGVTAKELWEFRNGLLHMINLSSRAVTAG